MPKHGVCKCLGVKMHGCANMGCAKEGVCKHGVCKCTGVQIHGCAYKMCVKEWVCRGVGVEAQSAKM